MCFRSMSRTKPISPHNLKWNGELKSLNWCLSQQPMKQIFFSPKKNQSPMEGAIKYYT